MHAGRNALREYHAVVLRVHIVLIVRMSHLMHGRENRRDNAVRNIFGCGAAVILASPGSKRMLGLILVAPGGIKMQIAKKLVHKLLLLFDRVLEVQEVLANLLCRRHLAD